MGLLVGLINATQPVGCFAGTFWNTHRAVLRHVLFEQELAGFWRSIIGKNLAKDIFDGYACAYCSAQQLEFAD